MRVLLTGASGFIGRQILRELVTRVSAVRIVGRPGSGQPFASGDCQLERFETADLFSETPERLRAMTKDVGIIVHCAWYVEPGRYLVSPLNVDCLQGTLNLARAFIDEGGQRFLGIGTCFEYAFSDRPLDVDSPLGPSTLYASCKAATYLVLNQRSLAAGMGFAWCRPFYLFGDGEDDRRFVPYVHKRLEAGLPVELTMGDQTRDYLEVRDAAKQITDVALSEMVGPVNICSGIPVTIRAMAERIADGYQRRDLLRFGARSNNLTDPPYVVGVPGQMKAAGVSVGPGSK